MGFCKVDDAGVAPGNDQFQLVGLFTLRSVKLIHVSLQNIVSLEENSATGGFPIITV